MAKQKILLDTDIGQDMDDACAIAYLCAHPESDLIGVCRCFSREADAKWAFLCYNERSIKNGEKRVNRKLQTRFCGGSSL